MAFIAFSEGNKEPVGKRWGRQDHIIPGVPNLPVIYLGYIIAYEWYGLTETAALAAVETLTTTSEVGPRNYVEAEAMQDKGPMWKVRAYGSLYTS